VLYADTKSKQMKDISNVSLLMCHEIKSNSRVYFWTAAGPSTSKSNLYSRSGSDLKIAINSVFGKKAPLPQRRDLCPMARRRYTNKRPPLTHFLCLPLLTTTSIPQLQESLSHFKQSVTRPARSETPANEDAEATASTMKAVIPEKAFRPLGVLHLTLGVMSLRSEEKMNAAKDLLESLNLSELLAESGSNLVDSNHSKDVSRVNNIAQMVLDPPPSESAGTASASLEILKRAVTPPAPSRPKLSAEPLVISLQGLQAFPRPRKATVLHCPPHDQTSRLYPFCLKLKQKFTEAGFLEPEARPLVLHATIVNTVYAKDRRHEKRRMGSISFNAIEIMRMYNEKVEIEAESATGGFVWANDILIDRVRICEMGAKIVEDEKLGQEYAVFAEKII
jgi:activating signal cointegrator complex subunit 1